MPYYSPLFENNFPLNTTTSPTDWVFSRNGRLMRKRVAIMKALNGAAAGGTALRTKPQVPWATELGGKRTIVTINEINRATVAGDKTLIDNILQRSSRTSAVLSKAGNY